MLFKSAILDLGLYLLQLTFAIVACYYVARRWKRSDLKRLMLACIVLGFLVPNILMIFTTSLMYIDVYSRTQFVSPGFLDRLIPVSYQLQMVLPTLSMGALLVYVVLRDRESSKRSAHAKLRGDCPPLPPPLSRYVADLVFNKKPRSWNTDLDSLTSISILRKREWAFLIDVLPIIVFNALLFSLTSQMFKGSSAYDVDQMLSTLISIASLVLIVYIPLKDAFGGQSLGKRLTDCRVVYMKDGSPIGLNASINRNWIQLIPFFPLVELAVASLRPDRRRLGDLFAKTIVVTGEPDFFSGVANEEKKAAEMIAEPKAAHPLDD